MKIWVDADACPVAIKEILFRAAERTEVQLTLVANTYLRVPSSAHIAVKVVAAGFFSTNTCQRPVTGAQPMRHTLACRRQTVLIGS